MKGSSANRVGQTGSLGQPLAPGAGLSGGSSQIGVDTDAIIRQGFIRKVYGILAIQLIVTFGAQRSFYPAFAPPALSVRSPG
jgi:hypothetical protein